MNSSKKINEVFIVFLEECVIHEGNYYHIIDNEQYGLTCKVFLNYYDAVNYRISLDEKFKKLNSEYRNFCTHLVIKELEQNNEL